MNFISRAFRFLFWVLILSWGLKLLRYFVSRMFQPVAPAASKDSADVAGNSEAVGLARRLVRDPVCGVHVAEVLAIPLREGGETLHFCSVACRDKYTEGRMVTEKMAANG
jgi:YHS domain-containing protein